jgi:predicted ribonuclease YlaK
MSEQARIVVDTNVLLNLATPVVDGRALAPSGEDPLVAVLSTYDVHVPASVLGEVSTAANGDDLLAAAGTTVLRAAHHLTTHDVDDESESPLEYGVDAGESHGIWLANELSAGMFVTDEFNTTNYLLVSLALADRNVLFTTPHLLCVLAENHVLSPAYVASALTYYVETKGWDKQYISQLRDQYFED